MESVSRGPRAANVKPLEKPTKIYLKHSKTINFNCKNLVPTIRPRQCSQQLVINFKTHAHTLWKKNKIVKIQQPGIKNDFKLHNTTKERTQGKKTHIFSVSIVQEQKPSAFQVKADEPAEPVVLLRRVRRDCSPCSGDQWVQGGKIHSTNRGFFFFPLRPPRCPMQHRLLQCGQTSGQVKYKQQYLNTLNKDLICFQHWNK